MKAIRLNKILGEDGCLILKNLPIAKGSQVEVIILMEEKKGDKDKILNFAGILSEQEANELDRIIQEGKT